MRPAALALVLAALAGSVGCSKKPTEESGGGGGPEPTRKTSTTERDPPTDPKAEKWAGLNEWSQVGDVRMRVTKAAVRKVPLVTQSGAKYESDDPELLLWVEVENLSKTRKIAYSRWKPLSPYDADKVTDEHGNTYAFTSHERIEGTPYIGYHEMRPGDPVLTDIVTIERPVDAASELRIVAAAFPRNDRKLFRFKIPASTWK